VKISACDGTGLKIIASTVIVAAAVTITACATGCEMWPSIATDKMYHGDCESTDEPMLDNETDPYLTNCTWARSSDQAYSGTYSYKLTLTAGTGHVVAFYDVGSTSDMHGLTAGKTYMLTMKLYVPSGQSIHANKFFIQNNYYDGSWGGKITYAKEIYDAWQTVTAITTFPVGTTGTGPWIDQYEAGTAGEFIYIDEIHMYEFDATDSGCQLVNSSVDSCTDTGVIVANSHAIIQNNQITGNTNAGLVIQAGYRNLVTNNRCYNNGSDTGLENTNGDNFYDAGIDTQLSGNSWQSPVSGEPSWGTPHTHVETVVNAVNPTGTGNTTVTCSNLPTGTKGIEGYFEILSATTAYRIGYIKDSAGNTWSIAYNPTTAFRGRAWFKVPLDSSKQFLYSVSDADVSEFSIYLRDYYI